MTDADCASRCSDTARERLDPLAGTAHGYDRWLMFEHGGAWEYDAFGGLPMGDEARHDVVEAIRSTRTRLLAIRRPGRIDPGARPRWCLADRRTGSTLWGPWESDADLALAAEAVRSVSPDDLSTTAHPMLLVCAHGRHDTCCAVRGRPVAAALAERWPDHTWECSHVGGDRFAPNVLLVPDGTTYGGLDPHVATDVVAEHLAGRVSPDHLRGVSGQPPIVQAVTVAAHEQLGPAGPGDVVGHTITTTGEHRWTVRLHCTGALPAGVEADVVGTRREAAHLTCVAPAATRAWEWSVGPLRVHTNVTGA
ncbi:sucrase ferredoxin [Solicola sp. PLA-1-18]|uniref:sucrase ferredoxin n=1 Tax=Solicola sp. PLA-1-18 TaxID=3380532 RepID=UPI003B7B0809